MTFRVAALALAFLSGIGSGAAAQQRDAEAAAQDSARAQRNRKRPLLAILEGQAANVVIQRMNRWIRHAPWSYIGPDDWARNVREGWVWDVDQFRTNNFGHPYGGGFYFNAGRDNGLSFWESVPLTFLGSVTWEYFAENERPSLNDLYTTAFGGVVFGEVGHRLGGLVRDDRARGLGRVMRELAAMPFDPMGSVNRFFRGDFTRVRADPDDRDRSALVMELQGGVRVAIDSGPGSRQSVTGTLVGDIAYGDAFAGPYRQPFDVFRIRLQVSPAQGGINLSRITGRLYGREITHSTSRLRHIFTVQQKTEYMSGPSYKFGAQSLEAGFTSDLALTRGFHLQTGLFTEWLLLGALDAPGSGTRLRAYDYGPGGGVNASASLSIGAFSLVSARYRFAYVHSISGSPADHRTNFASLESSAPLGRSLRAGAYAGWYRQRSLYGSGAGSALSHPEFRVYLAWRRGRGPTPLEASGGIGL